jgi:hypothetical protein
MQHVSPPLNNCGTKAGSINTLFKNGGKVISIIIILLVAYTGKAGNLTTSPTNSFLTIIVANNATGLLDKTMIGFNPLSTDTFNPVYDANKLPGMANRQTLYTLNSGQWMSINILPNEATIDTVDMGLYPGVNGTFTMSFTGISSFDSTSYIYLEDKKVGTWYNIRRGDYIFKALTTDDWNRFVLHFTPPVLVTGANVNCSPTVTIQQPGIAMWNYTLTDSANEVVDNGQVNQNQPVTTQLAAGNYTLTFTDSAGYKAVKTIQVTAPQPATAMSFSVSDTAVKTLQPVALTIAASFNDSITAINSYQWDFGNGTTGTGVDTTVSYTKPGYYNIALIVTNASGCSASQTQKVSVIQEQATGLAETNANAEVNIWSNTNRVYAGFANLQTVDATITIYNVLGQQISNESHFTGNIYNKEFGNAPTGYVIVEVLNNNQTITKKVFVANK